MNSSDFIQFATEIQSSTGILLLFASALFLASGGYVIYTDIQIRKKYRRQYLLTHKYRSLIDNLVRHFESSNNLAKNDFIRIMEENLR